MAHLLRTLAALALLTLTWPLAVWPGEPSPLTLVPRWTVQSESGPVTGTGQGEVQRFLGIPYAAPPVGALRWRPPVPPKPWTEPRACTAFGPGCPQLAREPGNFDEDCLSLNVWTPAATPGDRLPVMVWIHGGGFTFGSSAQPEYEGTNLARKGVVVVTLNYRLGPLGFLVHPLLDRESPRGVSGNYGLLDQQAALGWVARNVAAFGGDPANVTLFGQSAGSRSVSLQLLSPAARGLFVRAIAQSGGAILGSEYLSTNFNGDKAQAARMGTELARRLGADQTPDPLAALRARPVREILEAADVKTSLFGDSLFFAPVFDGVVLPRNPLTALRKGRFARAPVIAGSTADEGTTYLAQETALTRDAYQAFLQARLGRAADAALALFPAPTDADVAGAINRVLTVAANAQPARLLAESVTDRGRPAWLYRFSRRPDTALARRLGAFHGVDLAYVFGHTDQALGYDATDQALADAVMGYWTTFARTGDPNGPGLPPWPAYNRATRPFMDFADAPRPGHGLYDKECDFFDAHSRFARP